MNLIKGKESVAFQTARAVKYIIQNCTKQRGMWREEIQHYVASDYSTNAPHATNSEKEVVFMIDGKMQHGGLADRLRGIVSVYSICKTMGLKFKLHFVSPFSLEEFLEPNEVDWRIKESEICYNSDDSFAIFCGTNYPLVDRPFQRKWFVDNFKKDVKQIHVYTNAILIKGEKFKEHFLELFKMTPALEQAIDKAQKEIGQKYIAIAARFIQLLGDFKEEHYEVLNESDRLALMQAAAAEIEKVHQRYGGAILLTSDSVSFLHYMKKQKSYVHIIEGNVVHMDYSAGPALDLHLKTFTDIMMLSRAEKIFLLKSPQMYNSGFPRMASMIGNKPFELIRFMY